MKTAAAENWRRPPPHHRAPAAPPDQRAGGCGTAVGAAARVQVRGQQLCRVRHGGPQVSGRDSVEKRAHLTGNGTSPGFSGVSCVDGWMDFTVHGTEQGAWDYDRRTREIQHL
jgi:hypothetical protein